MVGESICLCSFSKSLLKERIHKKDTSQSQVFKAAVEAHVFVGFLDRFVVSEAVAQHLFPCLVLNTQVPFNYEILIYIFFFVAGVSKHHVLPLQMSRNI